MFSLEKNVSIEPCFGKYTLTCRAIEFVSYQCDPVKRKLL